VAASAVTIIKRAATSVMNAVKAGMEWISDTVFAPIVDGLVTMYRSVIQALGLLAGELIGGLTVSATANGIIANGRTFEVYRDNLDFIINVNGGEFRMKGTYFLSYPEAETLSPVLTAAYTEELLVSLLQILATEFLVLSSKHKSQGNSDQATAESGYTSGPMKTKAKHQFNYKIVLQKLGVSNIASLLSSATSHFAAAASYKVKAAGAGAAIAMLSIFNWVRVYNQQTTTEYNAYNSEINVFWLLNFLGNIWELGLGSKAVGILTKPFSNTKGLIVRMIDLLVGNVPDIGEWTDSVFDVINDDCHTNFIWTITLLLGIFTLVKGYALAGIMKNPTYIQQSNDLNLAMTVFSGLMMTLH